MKGNFEFVKDFGEPFQLNLLNPFSIYIIDQLKLMERYSNKMDKLHVKLYFLYDSEKVNYYKKMFIAQVISAEFCVFIFLIGLLLMNGFSVEWIFFVVSIMILLPFLLLRELNLKVEKRRREVLMELPIILNKIALLVNAGEQVQRAIIKSVESEQDKQSHPLYEEFQKVCMQLKNNVSFQQALEELNQRLGMHEVSIFTNTILMNYRRGGDQLSLSLRTLSHQLWVSRRTIARVLGEEASSKLIFPMILVFLVVILVVASPAILMMK
ncbi:type II secretion system F family protein [Chengkuizengella axinellae]|uniref:Type II secretion system F family protein n=1 Tax=Chengkuizengella axinellae TaxID=3064388 RepID=A0ABT9IY81_9BACL|nr:type II secretion system F family protein [Chengkuizengella sp. 2205SS18-9]MDP5274097.1 type II secretion system F family protein [Chengkuizengella sp. 2205SS18-9]